MNLQEAIRNQNDLALRLTGHIFQAEANDTNFVFSPLSIHLVLNLIAAGSSGPTLQQLLSLLRYNSVDDHLASFTSQIVDVVFTDGSTKGGPILSIANGIWLDNSLTLKHSFKQMVCDVYKAACMQADFQTKPAEAVSEVNSWSEKETRGLVKDILPAGSVDSLTRLIFANAVYFKGVWEYKFDPSKTKDDDFHLVNGSSVKVPFMTRMYLRRVKACSHSGFKVLGLPYEQGKDYKRRTFTMYFFLPDAKDGLAALIKKVSSESGFLERYLPSRSDQVLCRHVKIPRFKIQFGFEAPGILKGLGVDAPFRGGGLTEMVDSPITGDEQLYVTNVFHKAFIEVNEGGTEATAITTVLYGGGTGKVEIIDFIADHPFLYLIREDETGVVLFVGHLFNPLQA